MDGVNERIATVVRESGLTNTDFAKKLRVSQAFISRLASGKVSASQRTILDICDKFGINQQWLETGEGPMRDAKSREAELYDFFTETIRDDVPYRKEIIRCLSKMRPEQWKLAGEFIISLANEIRDAEEK